MLSDRNLIEVLAVNCRVEGGAADVEATYVASTSAALKAIRRQSFDLLLTGCDVGEEPIWPLVRTLRMVRPKLQWWLVAHGIDPDDERLARTLGMARLLAGAPTTESIGLAFRCRSMVERVVPAGGVSSAVSAVSG